MLKPAPGLPRSKDTTGELSVLDMGYRFRRSRGLTCAQCPVTRLARLEEAVELVRESKGTRLSLHLKIDCVEEVLQLVSRQSATDCVGFNGTNLLRLRSASRVGGRVPLFWDRWPISILGFELRLARRVGVHGIVVHYLGLTRRKVGRIAAAGFEVGAWTPRGTERMRKLLHMGVDRLYTDDPAGLLRLKQSLARAAE